MILHLHGLAFICFLRATYVRRSRQRDLFFGSKHRRLGAKMLTETDEPSSVMRLRCDDTYETWLLASEGMNLTFQAGFDIFDYRRQNES